MGAVALLRLTAAAALLAWPAAAAAHHPGNAAEWSRAWGAEPWVAIPLLLSALLYGLGLARLWRKAGRGRGISRAQAARFAAGWVLLAAALTSPLDALGEALFSAHMVQHELLMVAAAPLLVLGRPLEAWTWALPAAWRAPWASAIAGGSCGAFWAAVTEPLAAWLLHAVALWAWHIPALFDAALRDPVVHALQHTSFLATALAFWWSLFGRGVARADGAALASLYTTMMHSGALGALLTFAASAWYPAYGAAGARFGFTALEDQQLGGLVMWGPAGLAYLVAGLVVVGAWMRQGRGALR